MRLSGEFLFIFRINFGEFDFIMAHFVNDVSKCVTESLEGLAIGSFGNLVLVRDKNVILINPAKKKNLQ